MKITLTNDEAKAYLKEKLFSRFGVILGCEKEDEIGVNDKGYSGIDVYKKEEGEE